MSRIGHLTRRLLGSLRPGGPSEPDRAWVESVLSEEEYGLWSRMYGPDRRHSAAVAREVERRLGHEASSPVLAAALLHDVGKIDADLRTWGRVVATLSAGTAGRPGIVVRETASGRTIVWWMDGGAISAAAPLGGDGRVAILRRPGRAVG